MISVVQLRVLVIDDDAEDAAATQRALAEIPWFSCTVHYANTYEKGLAAIAAAQYDVILLDHGLGAQTGLDLIREAFGSALPVAVVLLTGLASQEMDAAAARAGISHLLDKADLHARALERSVRYALERTRIERELRDSEARYRSLFNSNPLPLWVVDDETRQFISVNDAALAKYGYTREEFLGLSARAIRAPEEEAAIAALLETAPPRTAYGALERHRNKEGDQFDVEILVHPIECDGRHCHSVLAIDVTERRRTERASAEGLAMADLERRRLDATLQAMPVGVFITDAEGGVVRVNAESRRIFGESLPELHTLADFGKVSMQVTGGAELRLDQRSAALALRTGEPVADRVLGMNRADGSRLHILNSAAPIRDATGTITGCVIVNVDISERHEREAERARLAQSLEFERNRLSRIFEQAPAFMAVLRGPTHVFEMVNEEYREVFGREPLGQPLAEAFPEIAEQGWLAVADHVFSTGEPFVGTQAPVVLRSSTGVERRLLLNMVSQPLEEADGSISGILLHGVDVTAQVVAVNSLRESEEQYRNLVELSPEGIIIHVDGNIVFANTAAARILGAGSPAELIGKVVTTLPHPDAADLARQRVTVLGAGGTVPTISTRWITLTGAVRHVDVSSVSFVFGGRPAIHTVFRDTTQQHELEEQLRQAQKMEAVGRLAGGVAHDFNNLLTVIRANAGLWLDEIESTDPHYASVTDVRDAAERGAALTRQLLAFSRKQILQMQALNCSTVVEAISPMLARLIGADVAVVTRLAPHPSSVMADPGQLEQVVLNLAVNARDAMPDGGRLTIETGDVQLAEEEAAEDGSIMPAGAYVRVRISDTGTGIPAAVRSQIFEPFFTTKPSGVGTGLGLATVHGIVKQSGGYLTLQTDAGAGTTFDILFPASQKTVAAVAEPPSAPRVLRGTETILLVDDEPALRDVVRRMLGARGYTVIVAGDGAEAMTRAREHAGPIHLVLTDMMMPEVGGVKLVAHLKAEWPALRVLFMSGYAGGDAGGGSVEAISSAFVQKPFSPAVLLDAVRQVLDGPLA